MPGVVNYVVIIEARCDRELSRRPHTTLGSGDDSRLRRTIDPHGMFETWGVNGR